MTWSKLELGWVIGASFVLSATACYFGDWFFYVSTMSFVLHFILLGRGQLLGFMFSAVAVVFYGLYSWRVGMAFHFWAQGLYLVVNMVGAFIWRYEYAFHKPQSPQSLPYWHDMMITLILIVGTGMVAYNLIVTGDVAETLRIFLLIGACLATALTIFGFTEQWLVWMQVSAVAVVLWVLYYIQHSTGIPGIVAWFIILLTVVICHYTHRT